MDMSGRAAGPAFGGAATHGFASKPVVNGERYEHGLAAVEPDITYLSMALKRGGLKGLLLYSSASLW